MAIRAGCGLEVEDVSTHTQACGDCRTYLGAVTRERMRALGRVVTDQRREASRRNGRLGGRPRKRLPAD